MSKINTNKEQPDLLGDLFKRIPEEELPASFRSNVMRQITLILLLADYKLRNLFHKKG